MMTQVLRYLFTAAMVGLIAVANGAAIAQSGDLKTGEKSRQQPAAESKDGAQDLAKDSPARKADDLTQASKIMGGPAGNPECVWLGRRVVGLLYRDDLDTAFRHLDLYDRFGCPGGHIQATFRCVVRQGSQIDLKVPESLNARVHGCWINPTTPPAPAAAANPAPSGTTTQ